MTSSSIKLSEGQVIPAKVDGPCDVFSYPDFILVKPRWVSDDEVSVCVLCGNKFNQLRRKHHCRQCGRVLCNKCCNQKMRLPQLGIEEQERVCDWCRPVAELITKSRLQQNTLKEEASKGLALCCNDGQHLNQIVQLGGIQTLISLSHETANDALFDVMTGIHTLSTQPSLHHVLVEAGVIRCICSILTRTDKGHSQMLSHGISALMVFCKSDEYRSKVLDDGALDVVLDLCSVGDTAVSLVAVRTLALIVSNIKTHDYLVDANSHVLPKILLLTSSNDEQMQEGSLNILVHLTCGKDWHRHRIVQEDYSAGRCLYKVLVSSPNNIQILCNAACIVANLATNYEDQGGLQDLLGCMCNLLQSSICDTQYELLFNLSRAIANFAQFTENNSKIMQVIPDIMRKCVESDQIKIRQNGMRCLFYLLTNNSPHLIINKISNTNDLLRCISEEPGLLSCLITALLEKTPAIYQPI